MENILIEDGKTIFGDTQIYVKRLMFILVKNPKIIIEIIRKNNKTDITPQI